MNWFFIALINPLAHAFANHLDKYLITRWMKESSVGILILFSSLFSVVLIPILFAFDAKLITQLTLYKALVLVLNGVIYALSTMLYFYALEEEEASHVVPLFQLIPVFGFIFGNIFLGEILTKPQSIASIFIVIGGFILSIEFSEERIKFRWQMVLFMFGSSILAAVNAVIFKSIALNQNFVASLFWNMVGVFLFGIFLFFALKNYRRQFIDLIRAHHYKIIGLNMLTETLTLVGEIALLLAILFAPIALVQSVGGLQPLFVFVLGVIMSLFFSKYGKESLLAHHLTQKIFAIAIMTVGLFFLKY